MTEIDYKYLYEDTLDQLRGASDTLTTRQERHRDVLARLLSYVEQGRGLTQDELVQAYAMVDAIFPRRLRRPDRQATPEQEEKAEQILGEVRSMTCSLCGQTGFSVHYSFERDGWVCFVSENCRDRQNSQTTQTST